MITLIVVAIVLVAVRVLSNCHNKKVAEQRMRNATSLLHALVHERYRDV